jgi:transposase
MPRAYAVDLRERSLRAWASGLPATEVARLFDVSLSSLARWRQQQRTTGALTPGQSPGRPRSITPTQEPHLVAQVTARPGPMPPWRNTVPNGLTPTASA